MMLLIIVLEVLAIAANLALPMSQDASLRGRAAAIARDMERVRVASVQARAGRSEWSPSPAADAAPPEVMAALPAGFTFAHEDYRLAWERWSVADPASLGLHQQHIAAVTVVATDPRLAALVARAIPAGEVRFTNGDRTSLVIDP
jgi:hypothetical protein